MNWRRATTGACRCRSRCWRVCAGLTLLSLTLSGCALYHDKPLPRAPDLVGVAALRVPASRIDVLGLSPVPLDPVRGFTAVNLMELAVAGDPQLKTARARAGVANAQLFAAGLLPDPQIGAGLSRSMAHIGYRVGLMEDVRALVTMHAAQQAAAAHARQVNLEILWQEWQVAQRARALFVQARELHRLRAVLAPELDLLGTLVTCNERELSDGDVSAGRVAALIAQWNAAERQWRALALRQNQIWHEIDGLLGLRPGTRLRLRAGAALPGLSRQRLRAALRTLPRRRPDLLALRAGYQSAGAALRVQILKQFPLLSAGVRNGEQADGATHTIGFDVSLTLPLFNRNRGAIAVARASRAYLYQRYQSDLDAAVNQADQLFDAARILHGQLRTRETHLQQLLNTQRAARASFARGELDLSDYTAVLESVVSARAQVIRLRATLQQARSALGALLALPL